jgi:hypothetical protein
MSSIRCLKLLSVVGVLLVFAGCAHEEAPASQAEQTAVVKPAGACQADDGGVVAEGTISSRCAVPGTGVTDCPRYLCKRCTSGAWGGEYTCLYQ